MLVHTFHFICQPANIRKYTGYRKMTTHISDMMHRPIHRHSHRNYRVRWHCCMSHPQDSDKSVNNLDRTFQQGILQVSTNYFTGTRCKWRIIATASRKGRWKSMCHINAKHEQNTDQYQSDSWTNVTAVLADYWSTLASNTNNQIPDKPVWQ